MAFKILHNLVLCYLFDPILWQIFLPFLQVTCCCLGAFAHLLQAYLPGIYMCCPLNSLRSFFEGLLIRNSFPNYSISCSTPITPLLNHHFFLFYITYFLPLIEWKLKRKKKKRIFIHHHTSGLGQQGLNKHQLKNWGKKSLLNRMRVPQISFMSRLLIVVLNLLNLSSSCFLTISK